MLRTNISILLLAVALFLCGCGEILGPSFPLIPSPRVTVATPAGPASGNITISFALIDRELESADILVQYSTDGAQTFATATLTNPADAANLGSGWYPGATHTLQWDSVTDMIGRSGEVTVCVKITPSDTTNPSGTADITGTFTVNNIAYNEAPTATVSTPAGVQSGNIQINYFLADVESDTCSMVVDFSTNGGSTYQSATMGPAGDGLTGLSSSPSGAAHTFLWDSRTDNVGLTSQQDNVKIRITPTDFNEGTVDETNAFSVDNTTPNIPPTVNITSGPSQGSTVYTPQVTFGWSGSDTDGTVTGYYYSFDQDPPDVWTTNTSVTSGILSETSHTFRVAAMDDEGALSTVASRTFTVSAGIIQAAFTASPVSGTAPLSVSFTDTSTSTSGITSWSWSFGDGGSSSLQNPSHTYTSVGNYTVTLTVTGPDGSDTETKTSYITVSSITSGPIYGWTKVMGAGSHDHGSAITTDLSGNVYVAGYFHETVDFGADFGTSDIKTSQKYQDIFAIKIDSAGSYGWTRVLGGESNDIGHGIAADGSGNVYVTGVFRATVDFGADFGTSDSRTSQGPSAMFVTKVTSSGTYGWTKATGGTPNGYGYGVATDAGGNVYVTGTFGGTADFGADFGTSDTKTSQGGRDIFVTKINSDGTYGWTRAMGGGPYAYGRAIATDVAGNVYVTGRLEGTADFGADFGTSDSKISQGSYDIFVTKINSNGTYGWTKVMGGGSHDRGYAITTDPSGNVCVTGKFEGTVDFGADFGTTESKTSLGGEDIFVTKINSNGTYGWTKAMGGTSSDYGYDIATGLAGNVYLTGYFGDTVDFGADFGTTDSKVSQGVEDIFVTKINSNGTYGWTKATGGGLGDYGEGIATDTSGNVYVTGYFGDTVDFGADFGTSDSKISQGVSDIFVTKIGPPAGARNWIQKSPANKPSARHHYAMAYDSSRGVVVLFGGENGSGRLDDTWEYDGTNWTQRSPATKPPERYQHSMAYDSTRGVVVVFGGVGVSGYISDTWEWGGTNWVQKSPVNKPSARDCYSMAYDPSRGVVVLFGGYPVNGETWEWNGTNWAQRSPANNPDAQYRHFMAYDSSRAVMVLFGGASSGYFDDTWEYDGTNWVQKSPANKPSELQDHSMAYDSSRGVVVLFGGRYHTSGHRDDTWEYDGTNWVQRNPANKPSTRNGHSMAYDSSRGVVVLFGGWNGSTRFDDTWEY